MAAAEQWVYPGSLYFSGLASLFGLPVDQVNFLLGQLAGLAAAEVFRRRLQPSRVGAAPRHLAAAAVGLAVLLLCYGKDTGHVVLQAGLAYAVIRLVPARSVHKLCLLISMGYLTMIHYRRLWKPQRSIDVSGPVMVLTMKATLLAFNIHDGSKDGFSSVQNKPLLRQIAISKVPSLVEFLGYAFNFQTVLVGPMIDFWHYRHFIETGLSPTPPADKASADDNDNLVTPSPTPVVLRKMATVVVTSVCVVFLVPLVPHSFFKEEAYYTWSWSAKWSYMYLSGMMARMKYYTAWTLSEAICNASGLGYSGLTADGRQRWDAAANVNIWKVEFGSSFREVLEGWNVGTGRWLRLVAYERAPRHRTATVYALSALWHGLDPCYYATFAVGALCTQAGREGRRCLRPRFQHSRLARSVYDAAGWMAARACLAYLQIPFVLLDLRTALRVFWDMYFIVHVVCLAMILLLPRLLPAQKSTSRPTTATNGHVAADVTSAAPRRPISNGTSVGPALNGTSVGPALNGTSVGPALHGTSGGPALNGTSGGPALNGTSVGPALHGSAASQNGVRLRVS